MKTLVIKKGRKGILRFPRFLKNRDEYRFQVEVSPEMMLINDDCDTGWAKVTGVCCGYHHWNSVRLVMDVEKDGKLYFGYYCYLGKVSPQDNKTYKSHTSDLSTVVVAKPGDMITFIVRFLDKTYIDIILVPSGDDIKSQRVNTALPLPSGWLIGLTWTGEPHLKCKAVVDTPFIMI